MQVFFNRELQIILYYKQPSFTCAPLLIRVDGAYMMGESYS